MNILHISKFDTSGGAAQAAYRLHRGLHSAGYASNLLVNFRTKDDPTVVEFNSSGSWLYRCLRYVRRQRIEHDFNKYRSTRSPDAGWFSDDRSRYGGAVARQVPDCDIVNLHWVAGFIDYRTFFDAIPEDIPLVWRLSDMNPFTGGCHFNEGCDKYNTGCGSCPQLGSNNDQDLSRQIWQRKKAVYDRIAAHRLHFIAQSSWIADEINNSAMLKRFSCTIIPNGLDTHAFAPRDRRFSRDLLGLPSDARIIFFIANNINVARKGFHLLYKALDTIDDTNNLIVLAAGNGIPRANDKIQLHYLGPIDNDRFLSAAYSSADLFVIPSLQDTFPNTVLEAMACGTPVVGFNVGGIPDMVRDGLTGILVPVGEWKKMGNTIVSLLANKEKRAEMSARCRAVACQEYAIEIQTGRYASVYEKLLAQCSGNP